jgi:hypothetical protein
MGEVINMITQEKWDKLKDEIWKYHGETWKVYKKIAYENVLRIMHELETKN